MGEGLKALAGNLKLSSPGTAAQPEEAVTVCARIGVASTENSGRSLNPLLNEADYALYQNRNEGRDKTSPPALS